MPRGTTKRFFLPGGARSGPLKTPLAVTLVAAACLCGPGVASAATTTLGSLDLPSGGAAEVCADTKAPCTEIQGSAVGGNYVVRSPVDGTIVSWRYRNGQYSGAGNSYSLRVLRPTNADETSFQAIATSTAPALPDSQDLPRGPFGVTIPIKAGDRIGLRSNGPDNFGVPVSYTDPSDDLRYFEPDIADGSTGTPAGNTGQRVLVQATIQYGEAGEGGAAPTPQAGCPPSCPPRLPPATNGRIAFEQYINNNSQIYTIYPDGSNKTQLTNGSANHEPHYSFDGSQIAFISDRDDNTDIWVMNAEGANQTRRTNTTFTLEASPAFSPDGSKIAFYRVFESSPAEIALMNADGSYLQHLAKTDNIPFPAHPDFSPDGSKIAFDGISVMNADGANRRRLASGYEPAFSPDGS